MNRSTDLRRICLTLPTNRACTGTISDIGAEAAYAAEQFGVEVRLLILDSSDESTFTEHAKAVGELPVLPNVIVHHLDEAAQRDFLRAVIDRSGTADPELLLELMLPDAVSYGACTNRAFLIAGALGCASIHRRDSDSGYQLLDGVPVFPIHQELLSLGRSGTEAADGVTENALDPVHGAKPVSMVGSSFIGELSVDVGEIRELDPAIYHEVVSLWAPPEWSREEIDGLVEESFIGGGTDPFTHDVSVLDVPDIWRIDMCNIGFDRELYERVPLPPATATIGSDYFLLHVVRHAPLPAVVHNRHIVNYYTPERRTGAGFLAYQLRFVKFLLSMLYFHPVYFALEAAGPALLDEEHHVRAAGIAGFARQTAGADRAENVRRLDVVDRCYRRLGGKYAEFADHLAPLRDRLLDEAQADIESFALLIDAWGPLVAAARAVGLEQASEVGIRIRPLVERDWDDLVALEARAYAESGLSEGSEALRSRAAVSPGTCFALEYDGQFGGYLLALPYPLGQCPDLSLAETAGFASGNLHAHDFVITEELRGRGLTPHFVRQIEAAARARGFERLSMVAVQRSHVLWARLGYTAHREVALPESYGTEAVYMSKAL